MEENIKKDMDKIPYELIYKTNEEETLQPFRNVVGHEKQKEELLFVVDWFNRSKELKDKGISIPRGVILFGDPGNGKSLLIKEIINYCKAPVFIFKDEQENTVEGIVEVFNKAKEIGHSIIVFDELDLLISKNNRVVRALQENLDGVESSDDILVLAATNSLRDIPSALLRNGRLEKVIGIPYPSSEEAVELFKFHCNKFNVKLPLDFDEYEVGLSLYSNSCAGIKAVVNDLVLRNGFDNITTEMIDKSILNISDKIKSANREDNFEVAIHEASHAIVAYSFSKFFEVKRLNIYGDSGYFSAKEVEEGFWPYDKVIADIKICMAGILGQKIICGRGSLGCENDLSRVRKEAYDVVGFNGYSSCWETQPDSYDYEESQVKRRKVERKVELLLKKCEKETIKYIKSHKKQILDLGNLLYEKKHLKSTEILSIIG